jgi:hypothetical protein
MVAARMSQGARTGSGKHVPRDKSCDIITMHASGVRTHFADLSSSESLDSSLPGTRIHLVFGAQWENAPVAGCSLLGLRLDCERTDQNYAPASWFQDAAGLHPGV